MFPCTNWRSKSVSFHRIATWIKHGIFTVTINVSTFTSQQTELLLSSSYLWLLNSETTSLFHSLGKFLIHFLVALIGWDVNAIEASMGLRQIFRWCIHYMYCKQTGPCCTCWTCGWQNKILLTPTSQEGERLEYCLLGGDTRQPCVLHLQSQPSFKTSCKATWLRNWKNHNVCNIKVIYNQYFLEFNFVHTLWKWWITQYLFQLLAHIIINNYLLFRNNPLHILAHEGNPQGELSYKGIHLWQNFAKDVHKLS